MNTLTNTPTKPTNKHDGSQYLLASGRNNVDISVGDTDSTISGSVRAWRVGTFEASRFDSNWPSDSIRFERDWPVV